MPVYPWVLCWRVPGWFCRWRLVRWVHATTPQPAIAEGGASHRPAGLRVIRGQRRRLLTLLVSAGDVWAAVLEINAWRRARQDRPLASYQELCRELAASGPGCFGELDTAGARSVLRRYSDAWFAAAAAVISGRGSRGGGGR
jgi:hypothetical protein